MNHYCWMLGFMFVCVLGRCTSTVVNLTGENSNGTSSENDTNVSIEVHEKECIAMPACGENEECYFTENSTECRCVGGYVYRNDICEECACGDNEECSFIEQDLGFKKSCTCREGYQMIGDTCREINASTATTVEDTTSLVRSTTTSEECQPCSEDQYCVSYHGKSECRCKKGLAMKDGQCTECRAMPACGENEECYFTENSTKCRCVGGYVYRKKLCEKCACDGDNEECRLIGDDIMFKPLCTCKEGYKQFDNKCLECHCDRNERCSFSVASNSAPLKNCSCIEEYKNIDGSCREVSTVSDIPNSSTSGLSSPSTIDEITASPSDYKSSTTTSTDEKISTNATSTNVAPTSTTSMGVTSVTTVSTDFTSTLSHPNTMTEDGSSDTEDSTQNSDPTDERTSDAITEENGSTQEDCTCDDVNTSDENEVEPVCKCKDSSNAYKNALGSSRSSITYGVCGTILFAVHIAAAYAIYRMVRKRKYETANAASVFHDETWDQASSADSMSTRSDSLA